ncbi:hypothetical protein NFJ02_27g62350 [Pycnococcus provasolii]
MAPSFASRNTAAVMDVAAKYLMSDDDLPPPQAPPPPRRRLVVLLHSSDAYETSCAAANSARDSRLRHAAGNPYDVVHGVVLRRVGNPSASIVLQRTACGNANEAQDARWERLVVVSGGRAGWAETE